MTAIQLVVDTLRMLFIYIQFRMGVELFPRTKTDSKIWAWDIGPGSWHTFGDVSPPKSERPPLFAAISLPYPCD